MHYAEDVPDDRRQHDTEDRGEHPDRQREVAEAESQEAECETSPRKIVAPWIIRRTVRLTEGRLNRRAIRRPSSCRASFEA